MVKKELAELLVHMLPITYKVPAGTKHYDFFRVVQIYRLEHIRKEQLSRVRWLLSAQFGLNHVQRARYARVLRISYGPALVYQRSYVRLRHPAIE